MIWVGQFLRTVSETERLEGELKLAVKMNNETRFDGFFQIGRRERAAYREEQLWLV